MSGNNIKNDHNSNYSYPVQNGTNNTTMTNMSVVPQISSRPNTLPINTQRESDLLLFTPNDYNKFSLSTPDLINVLASQTFVDGQPSPSVKVLEELFAAHGNNINNQPIMPSTNSYDHDAHTRGSYSDNHNKQENIPTFRPDRTHSQLSSSRDRSVSSSMNDNDSSNSTDTSSPMVYSYSGRIKDELQHVPSIQTRQPGEPVDVVKKEKKRERNRQAAQKCRTRKLTRIAELQKRVNELQGKNKDLTGIAECLKGDITKLEKQLQDHHTQGCTLMNGSTL
ncbi:unnamed protein product [Adineta steineri]|uniref:BZIP domain-containing protein n=1 Tax=Adineta steineri TaxID=433720 RepID=A0A813R4R6_9BILA|nr:unnamed protein product [Adineta steineri]CAF0908506.1 unnamed protein product [Adineta steineri]